MIGSGAASGTVRGFMREAFIRAAPDDVLWQVAQLMQLARIRHLPVLDGERLVGVVSHRDVLEASGPVETQSAVARRERLRATAVEQVMRRSVHTVAADDTLGAAAECMLRYKVGCLPVVETRGDCTRVVGLITESDLLAAAYLPHMDPRTLEVGAGPAGEAG